jgi:hypothetical protein
LARVWQKTLKEPLPLMEPKVETFERSIAFVGSKTRPVLVVHDYLKTSAPATFDWLLHAVKQMETDERSGSIFVRNDDARMVVRLVASTPYRFAQRTGFPVRPEAATNTAYVTGEAAFPDQWHLNAATRQPVQEIKFLAILVPYRASEQQPEIVPLKTGDSVGFRVAGTEIAAWWGAGHSGKISAGELGGEGRFVLKVSDNGNTSTVLAQ